MDETLDKRGFVDLFERRMVVVSKLPPGRGREVAELVNEQVGRGDAALRTKAEYSALFDALLQEPDSVAGPGTLRLRADGAGPSVFRTMPPQHPQEDTAMAVPRRKTSPSRRGMRRSADALKTPTYVEDKDSGELRRPHHLDLKTGMYKGRQILKAKKES